ncbi:unnamed protein product, partial [Phaeothamnion confervicola]
MERLDAAYYLLDARHQEAGGAPGSVPLAGVNAVILGCAIRGSMDRAFATAEALRNRFGLRPDVETYNALL